MNRICALSGQPFVITDDECAFLDRVSPVIGGKKMPIPLPLLCPDARQQRRLTFRNERIFYHRTCSKCHRSIIALYPADAMCPVYCEQCYWGDEWDALIYGRSFDASQPFFRQFDRLQRTVPHLFFSSTTSENSEFCNHVSFMKDCYLVHGSMHSDHCYHCTRVFRCRDCIDCLFLNDSELCYESVNCDECYDLQHAFHCENCHTSRFIRHCHGCKNLLFCTNRRYAQYQVLNEQYTKEAFRRLWSELQTSPNLILEYMERFAQLMRTSPEPDRIVDRAEVSTGNYLRQCENCRSCFDVQKCQDVVHGYDAASMADSRDIYSVYGPGELCYELYSASVAVHHCLFCHDCWPCEELLYCDHCFGCKHCFGCLGLTKKEYCILNKQYTKEEYEELVPKIIEKMRADGEWGEFFPVTISPFAYNETVAQEYFPLTKEEVLARGWKWRDQTDEMPKVEKILPAAQLPDSIDDIPDDILNWAIECDATKRPFKIIKQELEFYRQMRLPVPRFHPDERHRRRMALRNPRKLWDRECAKCKKPIATSYPPERPEIVYCESCYLSSVY